MLERTIQDRAMSEYDGDNVRFNMADPADLFGNSVKEFPVANEPTHRLFAGIGYAATYIDAEGNRKVSPDVAILADKRQREPSGPLLPFKMTNITYDEATQSVSFNFEITVKPEITLTSTNLEVPVGQTGTLRASVLPDTYPGDKAIEWTSSNPAIATVNAGTVTGVTPGFATVKASLASDATIFTECLVYVPVTVTTVTLTPTTTSLNIGENVDLNVTVVPAGSDNKNVTWTSSNPAVASVQQTGANTAKVFANTAGTAVITVSSDESPNIGARCTVTVFPDVSGVTLNKATTSMLIGGTETLVATVLPATATNRNVAWSSNSASIATVSQAGLVTGVSAGVATIVVRTEQGGFTAACDVTVINPVVNVTGVTLSPTSTTIEIGNTATLTATVAPANATNKNVSWSSNNDSVASVSGGVVSAKAVGSAVITVTTVDGNFTATCSVTVPVPPKPDPTPISAEEALGGVAPKGASFGSSGELVWDNLKGFNEDKIVLSNDDLDEGWTILDFSPESDEGWIAKFVLDGTAIAVRFSEEVNGAIEVVIVSESGEERTFIIEFNGSKSGKSGGCNAGYLALALLGAVPFILRKRP